MRTLWLIPTLWLGHYFQPLFAALQQHGMDFCVLTGEVWKQFDPAQAGANAIRVVGKTRTLRYGKTKGYSKQLMLPSLAFIPTLLRYKPQVVVSQAFSLWSLGAALLKPYGWKLVIIMDGSSPNVEYHDSWVRNLLRRLIANLTDTFIVNTQAAKTYLCNTLRVDPKRITVIRYLVPCGTSSVAQRSSGPPKLLYVGKLISRKGVDALLEACAQLKDQGESFALTIVGDGSERQRLETFAETRGLSEVISWEGWQQPEALDNYYKTHDVFIFPTLEDIWGMVTVEAMREGMTVLCSQWAGSAELITEGVNGVVIDPHDIPTLTAKLQLVISSADYRKVLSDNARQTMKDLSPEHAAAQIHELIANL
jgi:glycosyltransferase involved in cell wall biosynthesis